MDWDLNCDLGEGEPDARTEALYDIVSSVNVACGGHAGDIESMRRCVDLASRRRVRLGAHPGLPGKFGRGEATVTPSRLADLIHAQVLALIRVAEVTGLRLHHVKLHGALYHLADSSEEHARVYLQVVRDLGPSLKVYARAGGRVAELASQYGLEVWPEVFLDRGYQPDGGLVPRGLPGALLGLLEVEERLREWRKWISLLPVSGSWIYPQARTVCLHGDGPEAVEIARHARKCLQIHYIN